jgi:hypothetical protein
MIPRVPQAYFFPQRHWPWTHSESDYQKNPTGVPQLQHPCRNSAAVVMSASRSGTSTTGKL